MTDKQQRFCDEYLLCLNATEAAIHAGYSESTAAQTASRLLKNKAIKKYIDERQKETQENIEISQADVIKQLSDIGFAKIDLKKIRATDKIKAIELIVKILGLDKDKKDGNGILKELFEEFKELR